MARTLIICEKAIQANAVRKAIGDRYGRILHASGHILRLQTPNEVETRWDAPWSQWEAEAMLPDAGIYEYALPDGTPDAARRAGLYREIEQALKTNDTVIVATDPDREGQSIGDEILAHARFKGKVLRAIYNNQDDRAAVTAAFEALRDNREFRSQYESAYARQNVDQIFGFSLTRLVTREMRRLGWSGREVKGKQSSKIGIGRVRTAVWGMICEREAEIRDFTAREYYEISLDVAGDAGQVRLWHKPPVDDRLFVRGEAETIAAEAKGFSGPVAVKTEAKKSVPPRPADLPVLQKRASALWGWKAARTLDVLQSLYQQTLVTYPRAETRYLPEAMADEAGPMLEALRALPPFADYGLLAPEIRTGKSGVFSDAALAKLSHFAVVPSATRMGEFAAVYARLPADEQKLFGLVAAFYLAAIGQPHRYDRTAMSVDVPGAQLSTEYVRVGIVVRDAGWKAAFVAYGGDPEADGNKGDEGGLPPLKNGDAVTESGVEVHAKVTTPPPRYTDGTVVDAMQNVWRRVDDPELRQQLKATNGLGTPATRDSFIKELEADNLIETAAKGRLQPTADGMTLYDVLVSCCPPLFDPAGTATLEIGLDDVLNERTDMRAVIAEAAATTQAYIETIKAWASTQTALFKNPPTAPMLKRARDTAAEQGIPLPADVLEHFGLCREWLDKHAGSGPSPAQMKLAQDVAARLGEELPAEIAADRGALSKWLDAVKPRADALRRDAMASEPASEKQAAVIERAIREGKLEAPEGWPALSKGKASALLDTLFKSGGRGGKTGDRPAAGKSRTGSGAGRGKGPGKARAPARAGRKAAR